MASKAATKEKTREKIKVPKRYHVVMHNDDFTPMDFVVGILMEVFHKDYNTAVVLMMEVHKGQRAIVGTYSFDVAQTKVDMAMRLARHEGYPFRVTCEEA